MQIGILEPDGFDAQAIDRLTALGSVTRYEGGDRGHFLAPLDVLFVRLAYRIDADLLRLAPRLRYLCSPTTSHTHIDEGAIAARNIELISLRGHRAFLETIRATPEHTFGLILALLRRYKTAFTHVGSGGWNRDLFRGEELYGQTVGIIGLGRVGAQVARYCTAFGAHIVYYDPVPSPAEGEWRPLSDIGAVIAASRIVVLCASYNNGAAPIIGAPEMAALDGRYFINTARGELVDEPALLRAIADGRLAGVATDVVAGETADHRLAQWQQAARRDNVIVTPHIGGATVTSMARTERFIVDQLEQRLRVNA